MNGVEDSRGLENDNLFFIDVVKDGEVHSDSPSVALDPEDRPALFKKVVELDEAPGVKDFVDTGAGLVVKIGPPSLPVPLLEAD